MVARKHFEERPRLSPHAQDSLTQKLEACFDGDARVLETCRAYTAKELEVLRKGTAQRGRAIRKFLEDHLSGKKDYLQAKVMPPFVAKRIFERHPSSLGTGTLLSRQLQFFYGPDVIRDSLGRFRVLEDNVGYVGGFGDLNALQNAKEIFKGASNPQVVDPLYSQMVTDFRNQAAHYGDNQILLLSYPRRLRKNREDHRLTVIMKSLGIQEITSTRGLKVKEKKLFFKDERVSFLITNVNVRDIEPLKPGDSIDYFSKIVRGLWDAHADGAFGMSSHPGSECASDKEFYLYVEKMIRFYLNEAPILRNLRTCSLDHPKHRDMVFKQIDRWVVKSTLGQGGKEVWIGKNLSLAGRLKLRRRVEKRPGDYVAQAFTELSRLDGHYVDARPLAIISSKKALVSKLPWGRAVCISKHGKVNLSSGGMFVISDRA